MSESNTDNSMLHQIMNKLDRLNDKFSAMETSMSATLQKHSTEIAQLQKEKEQLFMFRNKEDPIMKEEIANNRHKIQSLEAINLTLVKELNSTMDELRENTKQDFAKEQVDKIKIANQNKYQTMAISLMGIILTALSLYTAWGK